MFDRRYLAVFTRALRQLIVSIEVAQARAAGIVSHDSDRRPSELQRVSWHATKIFQWTILGLIIGLAVFLRFHAIAVKSFWVDEGNSVEIARLPWTQFFLLFWHREANMAFYHVLLHFWVKIAATEGFVRGLSALFSIATVPLVYMLGRRLFGNRVGLIAAWLLALNAFHIRYAQETRSYSLVVFLAVLATLLFIGNLQEPLRTHWGWYSVACVLAIYTHFLSALVILAHGVSLLWLDPRQVPWRNFARSLRWIVYGTLPIAIVILRAGGTWKWVPHTSADAVLQSLEIMAGNRGKTLAALAIFALLLAVHALWRAWRSSERRLDKWGYALIFSWLLVPPILVLAASVVKPLFLPRYLLFCLPAWTLGVAVGIARLRPVWLAWTLGAVISLLCVQGTRGYYLQDFDIVREDWRSASLYILHHAEAGDAIFFSNYGRMPFEYYRSLQNPIPLAPTVLNNGGALGYREFLVLPVAESLRDAGPAPDRVWLLFFLYRSPSGEPDINTRMLRAYYGKGRHVVLEQDFPQITVVLLARSPNRLPAD
jgi:mannosyltransferase